MKKTTILLFTNVMLPIVTSYGQANVDVQGAITIQNASSETPKPGTIRWTGSDFQGYNGTKWVSLSSGVGYHGKVIDVDGNEYPTIKIGTQEWMAENLRTTKYRTGDDIPHVTDNTTWSNANYGAWCWYNKDHMHEQPFGKLYNWYAVGDSRGLCPVGWHVPNSVEWTDLVLYLGNSDVAGGHLKEQGTAHWQSPNEGATNSSGFTGIPGGHRSPSGAYFYYSHLGHWWSRTQHSNTTDSWSLLLDKSNNDTVEIIYNKSFGFSVRCLKDP